MNGADGGHDDGAGPVDELDAIAVELYSRTPEEFTAARDARAARETDRARVRAIAALRKPVVAAWVVSELARSAPDALAEALELGAQLREAQEDLDATALQALNRQRRALVAALAQQAADAAEARGVAVSAATRDAVERTLNAAMRDANAAAAVRSGRLVRPLQASGLDPIDLEGAVAGTMPDGRDIAQPNTAQRDTSRMTDASTPPPVDLAARRARKQAERAARDAERAASDADRVLARLEARVRTAREHSTLLDERVEKLRAELDRVARDAEVASDELAQLEQEREDAASVARAAARAVAAARTALTD